MQGGGGKCLKREYTNKYAGFAYLKKKLIYLKIKMVT